MIRLKDLLNEAKKPAPKEFKHEGQIGVCEICGKKLGNNTRWVEMDWRDGRLYVDGIVSSEYSQGAFQVGPTCYKKYVNTKK